MLALVHGPGPLVSGGSRPGRSHVWHYPRCIGHKHPGVMSAARWQGMHAQVTWGFILAGPISLPSSGRVCTWALSLSPISSSACDAPFLLLLLAGTRRASPTRRQGAASQHRGQPISARVRPCHPALWNVAQPLCGQVKWHSQGLVMTSLDWHGGAGAGAGGAGTRARGVRVSAGPVIFASPVAMK